MYSQFQPRFNRSGTLPPRVSHLFWVVMLVAAISASSFSPKKAAAQQDSALSMAVQAGFDGYCKENAWTPVKVTLENQGEDLEGRLETRVPGLMGEQIVYAQPLSLANNSRKETFLYIFSESFLSDLVVQFLVDGKPRSETKVKMDCYSAQDFLFGVIAANPSPFQVLSDLDPPNGRASVAQIRPGDLPDRPTGLQALDVLLVSGVDTGAFTASQRAALAAWVASGKRLIITGGPAWQQTAAGLGEFLPLSPNSSETLPGIAALGEYAGRVANLAGETVVATGDLSADSKTLVDEDGVPLAVERPLGSGFVYYLAFDPAQEPVKSWDGSVEFYRKLLSEPIVKLGWANGFHNLSAAREAVTSLPNLSLPGASLVFAFLLFYVFAVGPANYILLRIFKRRELAWISIPALVVIFSAGAILVGGLARGSRPILNRMAIVQVWPGESQAQVDGLLAVYSPQRATYQVDIPAGFLVHPIPDDSSILSRSDWNISDNGLQGTSLPDLRLDVSGIRSVSLQGTLPAPLFAENLTLEMNNSTVKITGSLNNQSELSLKGATLLGLGDAQPVGAIQANSATQIQLDFRISARAIPAQANQSFPYGPTVYYSSPGGVAYPSPGGLAYSYQAGISNPAMVALVGTQDFYSQADAYRKYSLLNATTNFDQPVEIQQDGFYLAGWSEAPLLDASLAGKRFAANDKSLYLVALHPQWTLSDDSLTLTAGLFTWSPLTINATVGVSPYDLYLDQDSYGFRFTPVLPVSFHSVEFAHPAPEKLRSRGAGRGRYFALGFQRQSMGADPRPAVGRPGNFEPRPLCRQHRRNPHDDGKRDQFAIPVGRNCGFYPGRSRQTMSDSPAAPMAMIEIQGLTKKYGRTTAVDDITLSVQAGEIFGFVGPNGAGKTTTIRMIATLLLPSQGEIRVGGKSVSQAPRQVRRLIGYMPDFFGVYTDMKVWEYLDFFGACYHIPPAERAQLAKDLLELVDLSHRSEDMVDKLSRGMKQRLSLARTLIHDPQVLILDEPASGLDPRAGSRFASCCCSYPAWARRSSSRRTSFRTSPRSVPGWRLSKPESW